MNTTLLKVITKFSNNSSLLAMVSTASAGFLMLAVTVLAATKLSLVEQGFFFTFLSFGALIQLSDFGISYAAMQTASHFSVSTRRSQLPNFAARVFFWNMPISLLATIVVGLIGVLLFQEVSSETNLSTEWLGPWLAFLVSAYLVQLTMPSLALREGAGKISEVWQLRLYQEWAAGLTCMVAIWFDTGLWSLAVLLGTRAIISTIWIQIRGKLGEGQSSPRYSIKLWISEVWPFQWRIGLSALSGFLIFRIFSPIILFEQGPILAGQFGIAIAMMNMLLALTSAWPMSQAVRFGTLIAKRQFDQIQRELKKIISASTTLSVTLVASLSICIWVLNMLENKFVERLTDPLTTMLILSAAIMHHMVACFAMPLRAERREPFLIISVAGGIMSCFGIWIAAHFGTARDIAWVNLLLAAVGVPIAYYIYRSRSRDWSLT